MRPLLLKAGQRRMLNPARSNALQQTTLNPLGNGEVAFLGDFALPFLPPNPRRQKGQSRPNNHQTKGIKMLALSIPQTLAIRPGQKAGTVQYMDRKTYGQVHNLKGAALNRAHYAYRMDEWAPVAQAAASLIVNDKSQHVTRIATNKSGGYVIRTADNAKVKAPKGVAEARKVKATQAELEAANARIAALEAQLAAAK